MENQHRKISGYRELDGDEIDLMNEIKSHAESTGVLIEKVNTFLTERVGERSEDHRWAAIGRTDLQQGYMALTRAVARPDFF